MDREAVFWTIMFLHEQQADNMKEEPWSWNNHGARILKHVGVFSERFRDKY
jgi:hypothetical protein